MDRRTCIGVVMGSLLVQSRPAAAQAAERVYLVAVLRLGLPPLSPTDQQAVGIPNALRELGYLESRNLLLDQRYAEGSIDRVAALARELVWTKMEVIVAVGAQAARPAAT